MANVTLSKYEKMFILQGIEDNFRSDGRTCEDFRPLTLETNLVSHANGSARVRLASTDILVCVKAEIGSPDPFTPDSGKIEFFIDCSANATPEFEGRGGEELSSEICDALSNSYHAPQTFDYKSLCLVSGQQCWKLYIDILILECGGNLFDTVSIAVKAALFNTKLPRLTAATLDGGISELTLTDHPLDCTRVNVNNVPLLVTVCKIGDQLVVDPTAEEEECSLTSIVIGVCERNGKELITNIHTRGDGSFHQITIFNAIRIGISAVKSLNQELLNQLRNEEHKYDEYGKKEIIGFLK